MNNPLVKRLLEKAQYLQQDAFITFTMIHPTDKRRYVPSRHVLSSNIQAIDKTLALVHQSNQLGWGAYVGIGYRKQDLGRYQRGGKEDILAIPALFADIERQPSVVASTLHTVPEPSLMIASGGGTHLYWMLARPSYEIERAEAIIKGISIWLQSDTSMTSDQVLRIPRTINSKPHRQNAVCRVLNETHCEYHLDDFFGYELLSQAIQQTRPKIHARPRNRRAKARSEDLNLSLSDAILQVLTARYGATPKKDDWYACYCPFHHSQDRFPGDHAYYNPRIGLFHCFGRHSQLLNHELAHHLNLDINAYGGIYQ
ncbi:MAG: hypothetical protein AAF846_26910 [Chloroflexota bacterium]